MKIPITLEPETNSIWTTYADERKVLQNLNELKGFVTRWQNLIPKVVPDTLTEDDFKNVKTETPTAISAEIILPYKTLQAMFIAKDFGVPLNCAFIQANGGMGEFENVFE